MSCIENQEPVESSAESPATDPLCAGQALTSSQSNNSDGDYLLVKVYSETPEAGLRSDDELFMKGF